MDITKLTAFEMKKSLHEGEISSKELVQAHFKKIDEIEKEDTNFITLNKEEALKAANIVDKKIKNKEKIGLLAGLPIGIKDNIMTKDLRTTCGAKSLEDFIPPYNARVVERINGADGIIMGKTNMGEFGVGPSYFGPIGNKGMSGEAEGVRMGEISLGISTDVGGSLRLAASSSGVVGITASYGIVSRYGIVSLADTLNQIGVFGRDVADAVLMLSSVTGYDKKDSTSYNNPEGTIIFQSFTKDVDYNNYLKDMKIGLPREFFDYDFGEKAKEEIMKSIKIFEQLGAKVEEISLPSLKYSSATYNILSRVELGSALARFDGVRYGYRSKEYKTLDELYINTRTEAFGEDIKRNIILGTYYLSSDKREEYYLKALKVRRLIKEEFHRAFSKYDVILSPTSPILSLDPNRKLDKFTAPVNLAGLCAMSIPCGNVDGLPIGLQIIGNRFKEANIIKAGIGFEGGIKNGL